MSFRFEQKLPGSNSECRALIAKLKARGAAPLYAPRYICSEYFDTRDLVCVRDSQEGSVPRKKIRIRYYPPSPESSGPTGRESLSFETKISSPEGRYKLVEPISFDGYNEISSKGFLVPEYGLFMPSVRITYLREYYMLDGVRLTYDTRIQAERLRDFFTYRYVGASSMKSVVEMKSQKSDCNLISDLTAGVRLERFSKYADSFVKI